MAGGRWDDPRHFPDRAALRAWLSEHHDGREELWVGFYRKALGLGGLGYEEAVDECLCWGWIDGIRKKVDEERYTNRITPRRPDSYWSEKNRRRYGELQREGRVADPGRAARARFQAPDPSVSSDGDGEHPWHPDHQARFQEDPAAWTFHRDQPDGYRRRARHWVADAKRASTRRRRLEKLIRFATAGERLPEIEGRPARDEP